MLTFHFLEQGISIDSQGRRHLGAWFGLLICVLAFPSNAWSQTPGPHTSGVFGYNKYIDPAVLMPGICTPANAPTFTDCEAKLEQETVAYYKAIGIFQANGLPTTARGTFSAWKSTLGFAQDPNSPAPDEIRATYFNNGDLQLGRDMHCRSHRNQVGHLIALQTTTYACYVSNFSSSGRAGASAVPAASVDLAVVKSNPPPVPLATVVMEVTLEPQFVPTATAGPLGKHAFKTTLKSGDVRFFAYDGPSGNPITAALLDSEGQKALPGLCLASHGGGYQSSQNGTPRVISSNFLPFDTAAFLFGTASNLSAFSQREVFRQLNQFVESTQPARPTIVDLIDGWYRYCGGVRQLGCYEDQDFNPFVPGEACSPGSTTCLATCPDSTVAHKENYTCGWSTAQPAAAGASPPFNMRAFYLQVVAKECRTCHIALADRFNVQNFAEWSSSGGTIEADVFGSNKMPFGEVSFVDFWSNNLGTNHQTAKDFMKGFYGCIQAPPITLTGDGSDIINIRVIPNSVFLNQVGLSMTVTDNITWWKGVKLLGLEAWTQDNNKFNRIIIPAAIVGAAPGLELEKAKVFGVHTGIESLTLPTAPFTYGGCTISVTWSKDG